MASRHVVMPECFSRASRLIGILDSRLKRAGMTDP